MAPIRRGCPVKLEDFNSLETPHPYGVLPGGNRFFVRSESGENNSRHGHSLRCSEQATFSDELWQQILSFCDGSSLARVVQSSRYFYVAGHQPELWRDLVLRWCYQRKNAIAKVGSCWKDAFVFNCVHDQRRHVRHSPMRLPGIFSDTYYRTHLCRSFSIPPSWLEEPAAEVSLGRKVHRVSAEDMTPKQFFTQFEQRNVPVIVRRAVQKSPAAKQWHDFMAFSQHQPKGSHENEISFRTTSGAAPLPVNFTLDAYHDYCNFSYLEEAPLYLFDRTALTPNSEATGADANRWSNDFFPTFYKECPYWDPSAREHAHDLLQYLGDKARPDHTWLIAGPQRSGSVFHIDPNCTHAWNACIVGRKRWIFYPPGVSPPGVHPSADGDEVMIPLSVGEWLTQYWTEHMKRYEGPVESRPIECTVHPGDTIFVPHGFWHMVINLDGPINIAITHNYASPSNLGNLLKFFRDKQDQISGCRDRVESIKPEHLHDALVDVLKVHHPEVLAKAEAQDGWTCAAWREDENERLRGANRKDKQACERTVCVRRSDKKKRYLRDSDYTDAAKTGGRSVMAKTGNVTTFSFGFL